MIDNLSLAIHALARRMLTSLSVDKILLPRYVNLPTNFIDLPHRVELAPSHLKKGMNSVLFAFTWRPMLFAVCSTLCSRDFVGKAFRILTFKFHRVFNIFKKKIVYFLHFIIFIRDDNECYAISLHYQLEELPLNLRDNVLLNVNNILFSGNFISLEVLNLLSIKNLSEISCSKNWWLAK